jgi:hypothetical protein
VLRSLQLLLVSALVAAPALARAETSAIVVAGDPGKKATVIDAIGPWLEAKGQSVMLESVPQEEIEKLVDCFIADDPACARPIVAGSGVGRFLFVMIEVGGEDVTLTGWLFGSDGGIQAQERTVCTDCRVDVLARTAKSLGEAVWRASDATHASLKIVSDPPGAKVLIDGVPSGVTPVEVEVTPGNHTIRFERDDHDPRETTVEAAGGTIVPVEVTLDRSVIIRTKSRLPWFVIGGGAAALVVAGVLLAIDEDNPPGMPGRPAEYTDTGLPAAVIGGVGLAAVGVGVYLMLRTPAERASAPVVRVSSDAVIVGWGGGF